MDLIHPRKILKIQIPSPLFDAEAKFTTVLLLSLPQTSVVNGDVYDGLSG